MSDVPDWSSTVWNNITKSHAALGEFVESFELMVREVRETGIDIITREAPGATDWVHRKLVEVPFHHSAITAKPVFEITRALIADYLKQKDVSSSEAERNTFAGVFAELATEYFELVTTRNTLLHGTWFVGFVTPSNPAKSFEVLKYKATKTGLAREGAPKDADELFALAHRCHVARGWIHTIRSCLPTYLLPARKISECFRFVDGRWREVLPNGTLESLP